MSMPVGARSKARGCNRSFAGIGFEPRRRHRYLSLVAVVCCQAEVSALGWSIVQRSPTEWAVFESDRESSIMRRLWPNRGCCVIKKTKAISIKYYDSKFAFTSIIHKGKGHPRTGHEGPEGEQMYSSTLSLTSALVGAGWSTPRTGCFTPGNKTRYLVCTRFGGYKRRSERLRKISLPAPGIRSPNRP
jgi:hypothetical protein